MFTDNNYMDIVPLLHQHYLSQGNNHNFCELSPSMTVQQTVPFSTNTCPCPSMFQTGLNHFPNKSSIPGGIMYTFSSPSGVQPQSLATYDPTMLIPPQFQCPCNKDDIQYQILIKELEKCYIQKMLLNMSRQYEFPFTQNESTSTDDQSQKSQGLCDFHSAMIGSNGSFHVRCNKKISNKVPVLHPPDHCNEDPTYLDKSMQTTTPELNSQEVQTHTEPYKLFYKPRDSSSLTLERNSDESLKQLKSSGILKNSFTRNSSEYSLDNSDVTESQESNVRKKRKGSRHLRWSVAS